MLVTLHREGERGATAGRNVDVEPLTSDGDMIFAPGDVSNLMFCETAGLDADGLRMYGVAIHHCQRNCFLIKAAPLILKNLLLTIFVFIFKNPSPRTLNCNMHTTYYVVCI